MGPIELTLLFFDPADILFRQQSSIMAGLGKMLSSLVLNVNSTFVSLECVLGSPA